MQKIVAKFQIMDFPLYISVSFPFLDPLIRRIIQFLKVRKAADFLDNSAAKIIDARKKESVGSSPVSPTVKSNCKNLCQL